MLYEHITEASPKDQAYSLSGVRSSMFELSTWGSVYSQACRKCSSSLATKCLIVAITPSLRMPRTRFGTSDSLAIEVGAEALPVAA